MEAITQLRPSGAKNNDCTLRSSFRLDRIRKRAISYLTQSGKKDQVANVPREYPTQQSQLRGLDLVVRGNILRSHLNDVFENVYVKTIRRTTPHTIKVEHDLLDDSMLRDICKLYEDSDLQVDIRKVSRW